LKKRYVKVQDMTLEDLDDEGFLDSEKMSTVGLTLREPFRAERRANQSGGIGTRAEESKLSISIPSCRLFR
jgi:hypothetical protein